MWHARCQKNKTIIVSLRNNVKEFLANINEKKNDWK